MKKLWTVMVLVLLAACVLCSALPVFGALEDDLIGHWTLAGDAKSSVTGVGDFELQEGTRASYAEAGEISGIQLSSDLNLGGIPRVSSFNQKLGNSFTVSFWIKSSVKDAMAVILGNGEKVNGHFEFYLDSGILKFYACEINANNPVQLNFTLENPTDITDGTLHHIAVSYDGTTMHYYVDGVLENSLQVSGTISASEAWPLYIGDYYGTLPFAGFLSDIRIYERVLSADEVTQVVAAAPRADAPSTDVPPTDAPVTEPPVATGDAFFSVLPAAALAAAAVLLLVCRKRSMGI